MGTPNQKREPHNVLSMVFKNRKITKHIHIIHAILISVVKPPLPSLKDKTHKVDLVKLLIDLDVTS